MQLTTIQRSSWGNAIAQGWHNAQGSRSIHKSTKSLCRQPIPPRWPPGCAQVQDVHGPAHPGDQRPPRLRLPLLLQAGPGHPTVRLCFDEVLLHCAPPLRKLDLDIQRCACKRDCFMRFCALCTSSAQAGHSCVQLGHLVDMRCSWGIERTNAVGALSGVF